MYIYTWQIGHEFGSWACMCLHLPSTGRAKWGWHT